MTSLTNLWVSPKYDTNWELEETVYIDLVLTNGYLIDPAVPWASCVIKDCTTNLFTVVATNIPSPIGIDFHPPTQSLLLSGNYDNNGLPNNFFRLATNGAVSQWSTVSNLFDEVKFAVVKATTNGWTNGYMYFGSDTQIGFVSSNAATLNQNWVTLTNGMVVNPLHLRGSIGWDQTGIWSNDLVAVCSEAGADDSNLKGVWRISSSNQVSLVANLRTPHLEGVMTVPDDPGKYGQLAGKILTGDESILNENSRPSPLIYAIHTNGFTTAYDLRIQPEDFDLITTNDLYCVNYSAPDYGQPSRILKVSKTVLANFVGDILITQAGEYQDARNPDNNWKPKLFVVHWDGAQFTTRSLTLPDQFTGNFEHVTFAPIQIPNIPQ